ncbi:MAG TPA: cobalamin-dependent protein, partial [Rectinemataceae bacterium]|nr:cobalamin-dependent protein [Rectinemataceae bacterium]
MPRVAIVSIGVEGSSETLPLGAATVVAALRAEPRLAGRLEAFILEGEEGGTAAGLAEALRKAGADWVGFSLYSWNRGIALEAARRLRAAFPGMLLFAGGPEATADPARVLSEGSLDFVVAGEGESACADLLARLLDSPKPREAVARLGALAGIETPTAPAGGRRTAVEDPAGLASPWLAGMRGRGPEPVLDPRGRESLLWELARGCPFRCAYCYESKGESGVRRFPMDRIEAELELFVRAQAGQVFVLDPTFNADRERAARLLALFARKAPGVRWKFEIRAELLDRRLARAFSALD